MLAGHLNAANARLLALIAELDRRKGWAEWGVNLAHWLNWKCGFSLGAAREKVRVAHALETAAEDAAAMAEGRISYVKVRAMTRVAEAGNELYLLNIALYGTASHVEEVVRGYRRALDAAELTREAVQQRDQSLWWHTEADGSIVIRGRLPAEVGALFVRALQAAQDACRFRKTFPRKRFRIAKTCIVPGSAGSRRSRRWPRASWQRDRRISQAPTAIRSSCTWMPRPSSTAARGAASWSRAFHRRGNREKARLRRQRGADP